MHGKERCTVPQPLNPFVSPSMAPAAPSLDPAAPEAALSTAAGGETLSCSPRAGKKIRIEPTSLLGPKALLTISHLSQARSALAESAFGGFMPQIFNPTTKLLPIFPSLLEALHCAGTDCIQHPLLPSPPSSTASLRPGKRSSTSHKSECGK